MKLKNMLFAAIPVVALAGCTPARVAEEDLSVKGQMSSYFKDPQILRRVDSLMRRMTVEEKIGQLVLYTSHWDVTGPVVAKDVEKYIASGEVGNIFNAHSADFTRKLQQIAVEKTRLGIPLLFGYDVIHGFKTIFPINLAMACSWNLDMVEQSARAAAEESTAGGLQWTFSPMCDVSRDPRWGRVSEGSGEDPYLVGKMGAAMVRGYQGTDLSANNTMLACVKHFAGYGAPQAGRDYHTVDITDRTLREVYLPPYREALDAGAGTVMTAFNDIDAVPATASKYLMTDILRNEWGFQGFVVTDYTAVMELIPHGVARDSVEAAKKALMAGVNMDMESGIYHKYLPELAKKHMDVARQIDTMCAEVLKLKFYLGLFDDPYRYCDTARQREMYYNPKFLDLSRMVARESMVLLQNNKNVLPIAKGKKIALIGPFADSQRDLLGSWKAAGDWDFMETVLTAFRQMWGAPNVMYEMGCGAVETDRSGFTRAVDIARSSDVVVMCVGEPWDWTGEAASRTSITIPAIQQELITRIRATGKPLVLVLFNGRPLDLSWEVLNADAILEAWYPGTEGAHAIADVVSGIYNPSGKLTMSFPRTVGQVPLFYDMKNTGRPYSATNPEQKYLSRYLFTPNTPLFEFGYGMSYTNFAYSDLMLSKAKIKVGESLAVSVKVTNTGKVAGDEVVQLYLTDLVASVTRPVKQLKGFEKVKGLAPGESREVNFTLTPEDMSFFDLNMDWTIELGEYKVWVGASSDAPLMAGFEVIQ